MRSLRKLFQLSRTELWLLAQAVVLLSTVRVALKFVTITRLRRVADRTSRSNASTRLSLRKDQKSDELPENVARMVRLAAERGPIEAKCLEQSLVLSWLLRRRGVDARILFGARKQDAQMEAHAWVEIDGKAINEEQGFHQDFVPFDGLAALKL